MFISHFEGKDGRFRYKLQTVHIPNTHLIDTCQVARGAVNKGAKMHSRFLHFNGYKVLWILEIPSK